MQNADYATTKSSLISFIPKHVIFCYGNLCCSATLICIYGFSPIQPNISFYKKHGEKELILTKCKNRDHVQKLCRVKQNLTTTANEKCTHTTTESARAKIRFQKYNPEKDTRDKVNDCENDDTPSFRHHFNPPSYPLPHQCKHSLLQQPLLFPLILTVKLC